jgi:hypothetical protein
MWGVEERGMMNGCGAPTLEKAAAVEEGELRASSDRMHRWGKKMLFFRETVKQLGGAEHAYRVLCTPENRPSRQICLDGRPHQRIFNRGGEEEAWQW